MDSESCQQHSSMLTPRRHDSGHRRLPVVFWPIVFVLVFAPALSAGLELRTTSTPTGNSGAANSIAAQLHHSPIPFLPVHVHPIGVTVPATVNPTGFYNSEPAPMGIGDFGVGAGGKPYTYNTTEFLGNFSWQSLNLLESGDPYFTDQLNVVLHFVEGGTTYAYWIQDVAFMDSSTRELTFENNIWNFSASGCLSNSAVSGNGTVNAYSGCVGYYAVGASSQPGADEFMPSPGISPCSFDSYLSTGGVPEVAFEYWDGVTSWQVSDDNVVWPWAKVGLSDYGFYVDGNTTAPNGIFYDAELTIGGPGGGSSTIAQIGTNIGSRLFYWNGHNLEAPRSVWNFGSDTAEAVSNVQSFFTHDRDGTPHTTQLNGTTRNATRASLRPRSGGDPFRFRAQHLERHGGGQRDSLELPSGPGDVYLGSGKLSGVGELELAAQQPWHLCDLGRADHLVAVNRVRAALGKPPSGPRRESTSDSRSSSRLRCSARGPVGTPSIGVPWPRDSTARAPRPIRISCRPTAQEPTRCRSPSPTPTRIRARAARLEFAVDSDPVVGTPSGNPTTVETGATVASTASPSGGSGSYSFGWTQLPSPCTSHLHRFAHLSAGNAGTYTVSVRQGHGLARLRSDEPDSGLHRPSGPLSQQPRCDTRRPNRCGGTGQLHGHRKRGRGLVQLHVAGPSHRLRFR